MDINQISKDPETIKQLITLLSSLLPKEEKQEVASEESEYNNPIKNSAKKFNTKQKRANKFTTMPESGMHKEDIEIDKKLCKHPPTLRNRPVDFVTVNCRICGRSESVNANMVDSRERYKCNNCSTSPG